MVNLIRSLEGIIDSAYEIRNTVDGIKTLIRVSMAGAVVFGGYLPSADINCFQSGLYLLNRLTSGQSSQSRNKRLVMKQIPEPAGSMPRKGVFDFHRSSQFENIPGGISALYSFPTVILDPSLVRLRDAFLVVHCGPPHR
jgi:hypothetical protein